MRYSELDKETKELIKSNIELAISEAEIRKEYRGGGKSSIDTEMEFEICVNGEYYLALCYLDGIETCYGENDYRTEIKYEVESFENEEVDTIYDEKISGEVEF